MTTPTMPAAPPRPVSVRSLFDASGVDLADRLGQTVELPGLVASLPVATALNTTLARLTQDFLNMDVGALLVTGWRHYRALIDAGERTRGTTERVVVELSGRDFTLVQHPSIDVFAGDKLLGTVTLTVTVTVRVAALAGVVRGGALVELTTGTCTDTAALAVSGRELVRHSEVYDPQLIVALGAGVPLVGASADTT